MRNLSAVQLVLLLRLEDFDPADIDLIVALLDDRAAAGEEIPPEAHDLIENVRRRAAQPTVAVGCDGTEERKLVNGSPLAQLAEATFRQQLPQLLTERPGQWVAYHGSQLVGFAKTDIELYRVCRARNIPSAEYIVRPIGEPLDLLLFLDFRFP
jgi:hypothetical protein